MKKRRIIVYITLLLTLLLCVIGFACSGGSSTSEKDKTEKPLSDKEVFLVARNKITDENTLGFEYDYSMTVSVGLGESAKVSGSQVGTSKYSKSGQVGFVDKHVNLGVLFNDGTIHEYIKDGSKNRIELNEKNEIVDFETQNNVSIEKYNSSSFAKALFTYKDADITDVKKEDNKYVIKSKANPSGVVSMIIDLLDHPLVEKTLKLNMPSTESDVTFYVTLDKDNNIDTYVYNFEVSVTKVKLQIEYELDFTKINSVPNMDLPKFNNFYITDNDIATYLSKINGSINTYKNLSVSSNTFDLQTDVDYGLYSSGIGAHFQGESKRAYNEGSYFINKIEVDTDHKNADMYQATGLEDLTYVRGKLSNGKVYDRRKNLLSYDTPVELDYSSRNNVDDYFLLLDQTFLNASNINSISTGTKETNTIYSLTLSKTGVTNLLDYINDVSVLNPFITSSIKVLGDYNKNNVKISSLKFIIEVDKNEKFVSLNIDVKGKFDTKFINSRDFGNLDSATFKIDYSFVPTADVSSYSVPSIPNDLKY